MPRATVFDTTGRPVGEASVVLRYEPGRTWGSMLLAADAFDEPQSDVVIEIPSENPSGKGPGIEWPDDGKLLEAVDLVAFRIVGGGPQHFLLEGPGVAAAS